MNPEQLARLADLLVSYSTVVEPGEVVLISGSIMSQPLVLALFRRVAQAGGLPFVRLHPDVARETVVNTAADPGRYLNPMRLGEGRPIDCSIGIWSKDSTPEQRRSGEVLATEPPPDTSEGMAAFFERAASGKLRWVGTEFPTLVSAQRAGMTLDEYAALLYNASLLGCADPTAEWRAVHERQQRLCDRLEQAREIRFITPDGTDLRLGIEGRHWINCDGHQNLPDGEVFTAPLEDSVNGIVKYSYPLISGDTRIEGIRLVFKDGRVIDAAAERGSGALLELLGQDHGARVLGEIALGTNYRIERFTGSELLDEKMGGTFHTGLGATYPQSGGRNQSSLHCDLICDLRRGGCMKVDGSAIAVCDSRG